MKIINYDNLPDTIVNDATKFDETTYLLIVSKSLPLSDLEAYFAKYQKPLDRAILKNKCKELYDYFHDYDGRMTKVLNSPFLRFYFKDIKRQVSISSLGITNAKKMISSMIIEIIVAASTISHQNLLKERYVDLFEPTIDKKALLKPFNQIIIDTLNTYNYDNSSNQTDILAAKFYLYKQLHAKYLIELDKPQPDLGKLQKIKEEINQSQSYSNDYYLNEITKRVDNQKADLFEYLEMITKEPTKETEIETEPTLPKDKIDLKDDYELRKELFDMTKSYLKNQNVEVTNKDVVNYLQDKMKTVVFDDKIKKRLKDKYQEYFYDDLSNVATYIRIVGFVENFLKLKHGNFTIGFKAFIKTLFLGDQPIPDDDEEIDKIPLIVKDTLFDVDNITGDFLTVLAYCLWHGKDLKHTASRISKFEKLLQSMPVVYETYLSLFDEYPSGMIDFSPICCLRNRQLMAILLNLDHQSVARRVRKIIIADYQNFDLIALNKKYTKILDNPDDNFIDYSMLLEMADLFVLSYIKDRHYLIPYAPFKRHFDDLYLMCGEIIKDIQYSIEDYLDGYDIDNYKLMRGVDNCQAFLNEFKEKYHREAKNVSLSTIDDVERIMHSAGLTKYFFPKNNDFDNLIDIYQTQLINYLYLDDLETFKQLDFKQQVEKINNICFIYSLLDEINVYGTYMPEKEDIEQEEYINSLLKTIDDNNKLLEIKQQQLDQATTQQKVHPENKNKLLEQELKYYQQEVVSLNKQLKVKDTKIKQLEQNQQELYKLRELVFQMENETDDYQLEEPIDLYETIKNKNIIIIGGHINLLDKLKQKYPALIILGQSKNISESLLKNADYVFMYYKWMNHDMYRRTISVLSKNGIPWDYIPYTNLEKSEQLIYDVLNK